jgi:hypothetical protein
VWSFHFLCEPLRCSRFMWNTQIYTIRLPTYWLFKKWLKNVIKKRTESIWFISYIRAEPMERFSIIYMNHWLTGNLCTFPRHCSTYLPAKIYYIWAALLPADHSVQSVLWKLHRATCLQAFHTLPANILLLVPASYRIYVWKNVRRTL